MVTSSNATGAEGDQLDAVLQLPLTVFVQTTGMACAKCAASSVTTAAAMGFNRRAVVRFEV